MHLNIKPNPDHAILWHKNRLYLLDQRILPEQEVYVELRTVSETAQAIKNMVVRGAPAIGITAAYGVVLAARQRYAESPAEWRGLIESDLAALSAARPTAVNLFWALDQMRCIIERHDVGNPEQPLLNEAQRIHAEDVAANKSMGALGAELINDITSVITHCNAGALATGGYGTALGVIRSAWVKGKIASVYADE
ncbi:MAG: S-methyl-5-thioribose-1-phosphate isomerase, partial [Gammaproteobacteria bacterium]|nr:S-methyl-5-thioribose-1-phosphate isomerase [Gammaproteobacteria bacterium]